MPRNRHRKPKPQKRPKRPDHPDTYYMVSPHDDARNFFSNAFGMTAHKFSRDKPGMTPVFKDNAQRKAFYDLAVAKRRSLYVKSFYNDEAAREYRAADHLVNASWGGYLGYGKGSTARYDFSSAQGNTPRVYVQGHGSPGDLNMYDDNNVGRSTKQVAKMLTDMGLPSTSDVRVNSCWSGAGKNYAHTQADWTTRYDHGTLSQVTDVKGGFAYNLHQELRSSGFKGWTSGYMTPTTQSSTNTIERHSHALAPHMGGVKYDTATDTVHGPVMRRKGVRVTFG